MGGGKGLDLSRPELQVQNHVDLIKIKADGTLLPNRRQGWGCLGSKCAAGVGFKIEAMPRRR